MISMCTFILINTAVCVCMLVSVPCFCCIWITTQFYYAAM